ncbi:MAG: RNA 2',3'-cyclic phosphodiesterase [Desulfarculus sp.]|nr:MAG: RNA 2',3'-cyclic phosphodiesterase [Desulfarculus sp.]
MRSFVALEMPAEVKEHAAELIRRLKASGADVKWVAPKNLHLTLKFLGEVDPARLPELIAALQGTCAGRPALELAVTGCGAFPKPRAPRVVWLGLEGQTQALEGLAAAVEEVFAALGFAPEQRRFQPHLTLGRLRQGRRGAKALPSGPLTRALAGLAGQTGPDFVASRVVLMQSTLTPSGAVYDPLHVITLA